MTLRVESSGLFTTIQDLGRPEAIASGVPPGGSMDRFALAAANLLVGNPAGAAALECTLIGPVLEATAQCLVAITGGDFQPMVDGEAVPSWTGLFLAPGDRLTFAGRQSGARIYIAVAGGIAADRWLGSYSTNLMAARGGLHGRVLKAGDELSLATPTVSPTVAGVNLPEALRPHYGGARLRAIRGPHFDRLTPQSRLDLFAKTFRVTPQADRMGYRLSGPTLDAHGPELLSFGLAAGAVQVPHGGDAILLMADHQTAGGYPVVATVVSADLSLAAQLAPGDEFKFVESDLAAAEASRRELEAALASLVPDALHSGSGAPQTNRP